MKQYIFIVYEIIFKKFASLITILITINITYLELLGYESTVETKVQYI